MIELKSVSKIYPGAGGFALRSLSFRVNKGEFVFLVGPSGSGKSTVLKLLTLEESANSGAVLFNGRDVKSIRRRKIPEHRMKLGVVFQDFRLIRNRTIEENLSFVMRAVGIDRYFINDRVEEVLRLVGLEEKRKSLPTELSGGEQQRAAIARAIINRPAAILADEPTGNLDYDMALEILELFERINREMKTTVLMVTHNRELVDGRGHRVLHLEEGRLTADEAQGNSQPEKEP